MPLPNNKDYEYFKETVWDYYAKHGRSLPWRETSDPYRIMVSEVMLQQTQVPRVLPKYHAFLEEFPDNASLAKAPLAQVLIAWSGLGYNRRAKHLHQAAKAISEQYGGLFPQNLSDLVALPGIGHNTAAAILAYAFQQPVPFIETNVRTVYIHHFFNETNETIHDREILELVKQTIDVEHPREWYWALMDYGTHLKATVGNLSRQSRHYTKQSTFKGSQRQIRGQVITSLATQPLSLDRLQQVIGDDRLLQILEQLVAEGLIKKSEKVYKLAT